MIRINIHVLTITFKTCVQHFANPQAAFSFSAAISELRVIPRVESEFYPQQLVNLKNTPENGIITFPIAKTHC